MAGGTFPTSVPTYIVTAGADTANAAGGTGLSGLLNAFEIDVTALATKLGTGNSAATINKVLIGTGPGTTAWGNTVTGIILTTPELITSVNDTNNNELIRVTATGSAVNDITVTNAATGVAPSIAASGDDAAVNLNLRGKGLAKTVTIGAGATTIYPYDFVFSGCVITADSAGSNLNFSMSSGVVVINGNPVTVAAFNAAAATASKDIYVDVLDNGDGTGLVVKTGGNIVANNAASPALASNSVRLGIVVAGATTIAAAASINQGQEDRVLPIASSIPYAVTDQLGNLICPRDPNRKLLGYRQILTDFTTTANPTVTDITGISVPYIAPASRKVVATLVIPVLYSTAASTTILRAYVRESATQLGSWYDTMAGSQYALTAIATGLTTPSAGLHTYVGSVSQNAAGTIHADGATATAVYLKVELE